MATKTTKPSLRHGLPYGWWRNEKIIAIAEAALAALTVCGLVAMLAVIVCAYLGLLGE